VTYTYKVKDAADGTYTAEKPTNAGTYTVKATIAETANYNGATETADFIIAKATVTVAAKDQRIYVNQDAPDLSSPVEGTHYTLNEDGFTITPTELATAETEVNKTYALMTYVPHLILSRTTSVSSEGVQQASEAWGHHWDPANNITMPGNISLSAEEAETNTYLTDVNTYVEEYTLRVITGQDDLASTWDSYVEAVYEMNIQDCIDAYQAAYTRYINR